MMFTDRGGVFKRNMQTTDRVQTNPQATSIPSGINKVDAQQFYPPSSVLSRETNQKPLSPITKQQTLKGPGCWVKKWVDYSSKYGLGYLLSNNSTGVFFNDSTKIVIDPDLHKFYYFERKAVSSTEK